MKVFLTSEEEANAQAVAEHLQELVDIVYSIIRLAALVPKALKTPTSQIEVGFFGMFLKTMLADLRSVHLLVSVGYPFAAATVASSLWEKSVMGRFVLKKPDERISVYFAHPTRRRLPWNMKQMLQEIVVPIEGQSREGAVELYYLQYTHLCAIKHPQASTISTANEVHFSQHRQMELVPGDAQSLYGLNFLFLMNATLSVLEFMKQSFQSYCEPSLSDGCLHLCGKLGKLCWEKNPKLEIPEDLLTPEHDLPQCVVDDLVSFWGGRTG